MLAVDVRGDIRQALNALRRTSDQAPFATALALTRTAQDVQRELVREMARVFTAPVRWTLQGTYVRPATKVRLEATVGFKDFSPGGTPAGKYLETQIHGGARVQKRFERALRAAGLLERGEVLVPGAGVKLDAAGNVPRGLIQRVLSQLKASRDATQNASGSRRSRARRSRERFFWWRGGQGKARGVWADLGAGVGVRPVLLAVKGTRYRIRLPLETIARRVVRARFETNVRQAWMVATR